MTAREIKEKAIVSKVIREGIIIYHYHFDSNTLNEFIDKLCKEQRENCVKAYNNICDEISVLAMNKEIKNAPQPEL